MIKYPRMKYFYGCLVSMLALTTALQAQQPGNSLLWEISGNGLAKPSWIFGTFHIMCKSDFSVSPGLQQKIKSSGAFYGELKLDDPSMAATIAMKSMMPGKSLAKLIGEDDYPKVSSAFQSETGMSLKMLDAFKPMMAESLLALKMITCEESIQPETAFMEVAKQNNIPVKGLESVDDQLALLDMQPLDEQVTELKKTILNFDSARLVMKQMTAVYKMNNTDSIHAFVKRNSNGSEFEAKMINNRNQKWIPVIEEATKNESIFFAVGAAHLGGPEGVVNLLRKRGYTLKPVQY